MTYLAIKVEAVKKDKAIPYLFEHYNVKLLYPDAAAVPNYDDLPFLSRVYNQMVDEMNLNFILPRYIIVMLDLDLIVNASLFDYGVFQNHRRYDQVVIDQF